MLLRRLVAVVCPLLLCLLTCVLFGWLDGLMKAGGFFLFALKGLVLGLCLGLMLPVAGITTRSSGLNRWLFAAAGLILLLLLYQYLDTNGVLRWAWLRSLVSLSGQVILAESAAAGFLLLTAVLEMRRQARAG